MAEDYYIDQNLRARAPGFYAHDRLGLQKSFIMLGSGEITVDCASPHFVRWLASARKVVASRIPVPYSRHFILQQ